MILKSRASFEKVVDPPGGQTIKALSQIVLILINKTN